MRRKWSVTDNCFHLTLFGHRELMADEVVAEERMLDISVSEDGLRCSIQTPNDSSPLHNSDDTVNKIIDEDFEIVCDGLSQIETAEVLEALAFYLRRCRKEKR
jgi:hypothetical protein